MALVCNWVLWHHSFLVGNVTHWSTNAQLYVYGLGVTRLLLIIRLISLFDAEETGWRIGSLLLLLIEWDMSFVLGLDILKTS
jgi:hypothetical protein